jgi:Arc/MetJ family transcription regulator
MSVKATFVLDDLILQQAKESVKEHGFKSLSAFVEKAVRDELEKFRQEKIRSALRSAGNDPLFLADVLKVQEDFEYSDFEKEAP